MGAILQTILGSLVGGSGVGSAVANVGKWAAVLAIAVPAWQWYQGHQNDIAVSFTWSQLAAVALIVYALLEVAHRAAGPGLTRGPGPYG